VTLGKTVKVITADGEYIGVAVDVGPLGELYIDTGDGVRAFYAGDVVHVR
jgi:biotin-(acetyl-CoA carboxylase) ligase